MSHRNQKVVTQNFIIEPTGDKYFSNFLEIVLDHLFTWCAGVRQCPDFPKIGVRGHKCCHSLHPDRRRHKNWTYHACRGHFEARGLCRHRHLVVVLKNTKTKSSISNEKTTFKIFSYFPNLFRCLIFEIFFLLILML